MLCFLQLFLVQGSKCPFLLRDLLSSKELQVLCEPHRMKMFQIFLGGPLSLNLRNLVWHGFVAPGEIPLRFVAPWFRWFSKTCLIKLMRLLSMQGKTVAMYLFK